MFPKLSSTLPKVSLAGVVASFAATAAVVLAASPERRILHCSLAKDTITYSDCDAVGYGISIALTFIPGVIMAVFTFLTFPYFVLARWCCNCCGSSRQTEGVCCACGNTPAARYSWFEILRVKIYALICAVFAVVGISYGFAAAARSKSGIVDLLDSVGGIGRVILGEIDSLGKSLTVSFYNSTTDTFYESNLLLGTAEGRNLNSTVHDLADSLDSTVKSATSVANDYLEGIMIGLFFVILAPCVCMGLNLVFAIFNIRNWGPAINTACLFLFMIILWIIHSVIATAGFVVSDVCAELKGLADQEKNVVSAMIDCPTSILDKMRETFTELEKSEAAKACKQMNDTCIIPTSSNAEFVAGIQAGRTFNCPPDFLQCTNATFARLLNYSNTLKMNASVYDLANADSEGYVCRNTASDNCTLARCADTCTKPDNTRSATGKSAATAVYSFRAASTVSNVFADVGAKFYVCDSLFSLVSSPMATPCVEASGGFFDVYMSSGMVLMFSIYSVYVCSWGAKRFLPFSEAGKLQKGAQAIQDSKEERPIPTTMQQQ